MFNYSPKNWYLDLMNIRPLKNFEYCWSGLFVAPSSEWTHMTRKLAEYELFMMVDGTLHIADEQNRYTLSKNEYLIMPPTKRQYGFKPSYASFYWLHFLLPKEDCMDSEVISSVQDLANHNEKSCLLSQTQVSKETTLKDTTYLKNTGIIINNERLAILLNQLQETEQHYHHALTTSALAQGILLELYNQQSNAKKVKLSNKEQLYHDILDYINFNRLSKIYVSSIADYFGYHEKYISTFFKQMSGIPLKQYLLKEMMEHAKVELATTDKTITQIAYSLGYSDNHNFTHAFKHVTGLSPLAYRMSFTKKN